jgi:hypothetical protein
MLTKSAMVRKSVVPAGQLLVAVGVPVITPVDEWMDMAEDTPAMDGGRIIGDVFPAGDYVCITHTGDYGSLKDAHSLPEDWMKKEDWDDRHKTADGATTWRSRTEFYMTDPGEEPDPGKWETDIEFLIAYDGEYSGARNFF